MDSCTFFFFVQQRWQKALLVGLFCVRKCVIVHKIMLSKWVCVWQQTAVYCSNGRGQEWSIAASCHSLSDLKRQCANSVHTHTHTCINTQLHTSYYTQPASLEEMKHHCHTRAHKHTSQPQVFPFVKKGNKRHTGTMRGGAGCLWGRQ